MNRFIFHLKNYTNPNIKMGRVDFVLMLIFMYAISIIVTPLFFPAEEIAELWDTALKEGTPFYPDFSVRITFLGLSLLTFMAYVKRLKDLNIKNASAIAWLFFVPQILTTFISYEGQLKLIYLIGVLNILSTAGTLYLCFATNKKS